jgi:ABC-type Fe3+-hydroxamate transport system substrate-binding protein
LKKNILLLTLLLCFLGLNVFAQSEIKVVSLSPVASKALILLEADDLVVGCTKWCPYADQKLIVASAIDVNVEQVLRAKPSVVFASTLTNKESIETLPSLGIDVVALPSMLSFEVMCTNLLLIAKKVDKEEKALLEIQIAKARLAEVKRKIPQGESPKVMFQVGSKPIFVGMPHTFIDEYITQAGAINIYSDLLHGTVTRESVLLRNPDAIFISTMPTSADNAKEGWLQYNELSATQKNQVVLIDQEIASSPTIHTFVEVVGIMIDVLYN